MMEKWRSMAIARLMDYETIKQAKKNLPEEIARCGWDKQATEQQRLDVMAQKIFLRERLRQVKRWLDVTHKGLGVLTPEERLVVQLLYIMPRKGNLGKLCEILCCGQSTVYRRRDKALEKFTVALYGKEN